jgi:hypothetical protein
VSESDDFLYHVVMSEPTVDDLTVFPAGLQVGDVVEGHVISSIQRNGFGYEISFLGFSEAPPDWYDYADAVKILRPWQR